MKFSFNFSNLKLLPSQTHREQLGDEKPDGSNDHEEEEARRGKAVRQMEESGVRLEKLRDDGMLLVTNVRTASDAREMHHKVQDSQKKLDRWVLRCGKFLVY